MLRAALITCAVLLLIAGVGFLLAGFWAGAIESLLIGGIGVTALIFERWRYRPKYMQPDPSWQRTGERFSEAVGGETVDVYYDPSSGERHYVVVRNLLP